MPLWAWTLVSLVAGCAAGASTVGMLWRLAPPGVCPRCAGYLKWRANFFRAHMGRAVPRERDVW